MSIGHHPLPSARRLSDEGVARHVRTEYGENDACWFASGAAKGACLNLPGENGSRAALRARFTAAGRELALPVTGTVTGARAVRDLVRKSDPAADR